MKLPVPSSIFKGRGRSGLNGGFTLTEIIVAMSIFILVVSGIVTAHLFGLRMFQVNETKMTATEWSHRTFGKITDEIRSCNSVTVGNLNSKNNLFEGFLDGELQQGSGLLIYPTANSTNYILYFVNTADQTFRRATDQSSSGVILADSVTNNTVFSAQDFSGNVMTNSAGSNSPVIHLTLEFYQPQRFMQDPHQYKLETSVKQRIVP